MSALLRGDESRGSDGPASAGASFGGWRDNWLGVQRIGNGSYDALSGPLGGMLYFSVRRPPAPRLFLDPNTGEPAGSYAC